MVAGSLLGRNTELTRIAAMVDSIAAGPRALTLAGEAGIGKTAIWSAALAPIREAGAVRVLVARASEAEASLGYVALGDLFGPVESDVLGDLPAPQADALAAALLLRTTDDDPIVGDPRTLGTAVLGAIRRLTSGGPLLLAIDDVQWLDPSSTATLVFALRRAVDAGLPIGVLATLRTPAPHPLAAALPAEHELIDLGPVSLGVLHQLLRDRLDLSLTRPQLIRLEEASGGNPLLALEIGRELARLDRWPLPGEPLPVPADAGGLIAERIARLEPVDRDVLFVLAASSDADVTSAATTLGISPAAVHEALVRLGRTGAALLEPDDDGVPRRFAHPLVTAAALAGPSPDRRRVLHTRLAELASDPEDRGRHAALASTGRDAETAAALDAAARSARRRGAPQLAAEWAEAAAERTPDADRAALGAARRIRAARWFGDSGAIDRADVLLQQALADLPAGDRHAEALELAAQMAGWRRGGAAVVEIARAALEEADDPVIRSRLLLRLATEVDEIGVVAALAYAEEAVTLLEAAGIATSDPDLLACALIQAASLRYASGAGDDEPTMQRAVALLAADPRLRADGDERPEGQRAHQDVVIWLVHHDRLDEALVATRRMADRARERGHDRPLPIIECDLAYLAAWSGDLVSAAAHAEASLEAASLSDHPQARVAALAAAGFVALLRGELDAADTYAAGGLAEDPDGDWLADRHRVIHGSAALARGDGATATRWLGDVLDSMVAQGRRESLEERFAGDLVEAAILAGDLERASSTVDLLEGSVERLPRRWIRVMAPRGRAMLLAAEGDLDGADQSVRQALDAAASLPMPFELARTELIAGRIARRRKEKRRAGEHLDRAIEGFERMGAEAWRSIAQAERARLGRRGAADPARLTETEDQVARLAARGLTNREVGEAAFLTPKSVEGVLGRVYGKLGIRSRAELGAWLAAGAPGGPGLGDGQETGNPPFRPGAGQT